MVATVQPYSSINEVDKRILREPLAAFSTAHFQENVCTQCTQTDSCDFTNGAVEKSSGDLCAEIQKLNRFRKKIEEDVATKKTKVNPVERLISSNNSLEEKRLQYYKDRLELLENKILVYESSGDVQIKRLAERLQREVQLESWVKQLTERVNKLVEENLQLEDERCEFEEAENDTRLLLQKLEIDLEILKQRNVELEMFRDTARAHAHCLEDTIARAQERIKHLEEHRSDLKQKLEMLTAFMPSILLYNTWKTQVSERDTNSYMRLQTVPSICSCIKSYEVTHHHTPQYEKLYELIHREKELKQNIVELNRAFNETLENADNLWAQMEKEYKEKLVEAADEIHLLRCKINHLDERLNNDSISALERINLLEESECELTNKIQKLTRDQKEEADKLESKAMELIEMKQKYTNLKQYLAGTCTEILEKERKKSRDLEEHLREATQLQNETEEIHLNQVHTFKRQLSQVKSELTNIVVNNGELKEEVATLETRCVELNNKRNQDDETIRMLSEELQCKYEQINMLNSKLEKEGESLAQEMKFLYMNNQGNRGFKQYEKIDQNELVTEYAKCAYNNILADNRVSSDLAYELSEVILYI